MYVSMYMFNMHYTRECRFLTSSKRPIYIVYTCKMGGKTVFMDLQNVQILRTYRMYRYYGPTECTGITDLQNVQVLWTYRMYRYYGPTECTDIMDLQNVQVFMDQ